MTLATPHRTPAHGLALAYGLPLQTARNVLCTDPDDWEIYGIVKAAVTIGPIRCYRDHEGNWCLDGAYASGKRIQQEARRLIREGLRERA